MKTKALLVLALIAVAAAGYGQQTLYRQGGSLGNGDARDGAGGFVEQFAVPVPSESRIAVLVVSVDFLPGLVVETADGVRAAEFRGFGSAYATVYSDEADTLTVRVSGAPGERGAYTARVYALPAEEPVRVPEDVPGTLTRDDESLSDGRFIDWYPLQMRRGQRVTVLASAEFDSYLIVEYPNGRRVENDDWVDTDAGTYLTATQDMTLLIGVTSLSEGVTGAYTLSVERAPTPAEISIGEVVNGSLTESDSDRGLTADRYLLSGREGSLVRIRLESDDFDPFLVAADGMGNVLENDDAADGSRNSEIRYAFTEDSFLEITVRAFDETERGNYRLEVGVFESDYAFREVADGYRLSDGERVFTVMRDGVARYTLESDANRNVTVFAESESFDAVLEVTTPTGEIIRDDDSGGDSNPLARFVAETSGVYTVHVSSYSGDAGGTYTVGFDYGTRARVIARLARQLDRDDKIDISGRRYEEIDIELSAGERITITASSTDFDTYLYLRDPSGSNVVENDDGPTGSDAQVTYTAPRGGTYSVIVTSFSEGGLGAYRLLVTGDEE